MAIGALTQLPPDDTPAARALRVWMARYKVNGRQLAKLLGCHPVHVSELAHAKTKPSRARAAALERITEGEVSAALWDPENEGDAR